LKTFQNISLKIHERQRREHPIDDFLVGLMKLLDRLVTLIFPSQEHLEEDLEILIGNKLMTPLLSSLFTFPTSSNHGSLALPKCKTKKSRKTALHLLLTLCNFCPNNFQTVLDFLLNNHHSFNDGTNNQQYPRQDLVTE